MENREFVESMAYTSQTLTTIFYN